ncbi:glutathione S-transferase family protein [Zobellella maritima]|uniref:glutathione S-transferase family protein n=1 Tax=Zobellella maritima TaxID=2059725 RepID=UPI000E304CCF|nr:glutathione S-transferase family protein [Zobellella maritima]
MKELFIANKNYSSWSLRPWVLMRMLDIPFNEHLEPFGSGSNWSTFRRFSPTGKVPCLVDNGVVVWDSLGITEYLAEHYPGVWPRQAEARAWARCAAAEMHSGFFALRNQCPMNCGLQLEMNGVDAELRQDIDRLNELWQEGLARFGGPWLAGGAFSAVDAFFAPVAFRVSNYGLKLVPAADDYVRQLLALKPMQDWLDAALLEPWREPGHEAEARQAGKILADRRLPVGSSTGMA